MFNGWLGGLVQHTRELIWLFAPTVNAYKRYQLESWAPTALAWGVDNRTCGFRVVGHAPPSLRVESRVPGADCNPYGPCEAWCALFATWVWEQAGVPIPSYAFTGDVYNWAQSASGVLPPSATPSPGDAVLYGTGPWSTASSLTSSGSGRSARAAWGTRTSSACPPSRRG